MQGFKVKTVPIGVLVKVRKPFNLIGLPYENSEGVKIYGVPSTESPVFLKSASAPSSWVGWLNFGTSTSV